MGHDGQQERRVFYVIVGGDKRIKVVGSWLSKRNGGSSQILRPVKLGSNQPPISGADLNASPLWLLFTICATSRSYPARSKKDTLLSS